MSEPTGKTPWNLDRWDVQDGQESRMTEDQKKALEKIRWHNGEFGVKFPKITIIFFVIVVLVGLAAWVFLLSDSGQMTVLANDINDYGYYLKTDDLEVIQKRENATIAELLQEQGVSDAGIKQRVDISHTSSMPADVNVRGTITQVESELYNGDRIVMFLLDGKREVGYVKVPDSGEIYELGGSTIRAKDTSDR